MTEIRTAICEAITVLGEPQGSTHQAMWKLVKNRFNPEPRYADYMLALKKLSDAKEYIVKEKSRYRMPLASKKKLIKVLSKGKTVPVSTKSRALTKKVAKKKMDAKKKSAKRAAVTRKKGATKAAKLKKPAITKKKSAGQVKKQTKKKIQ
jgi:hypothetical protein